MLGELLDRVWIQGQAEEMRISVTPRKVAEKLKKLKKQSFQSEAEYKKFLKEGHYTQEDVNELMKVQILTEMTQQRVSEGTPVPSRDEIAAYYEAAKPGQFINPETRKIRRLYYEEKAAAEAAKARLEQDDSPANWRRLEMHIPEYRSLVTTADELSKWLRTAVFSAPVHEVEGPVVEEGGYYIVFEVEKVVEHERAESLEEAEGEIGSRLAEQAQWFSPAAHRSAIARCLPGDRLTLTNPRLTQQDQATPLGNLLETP